MIFCADLNRISHFVVLNTVTSPFSSVLLHKCLNVMFCCSGLDEGLPCSYFHETAGLTEVQRIERYVLG